MEEKAKPLSTENYKGVRDFYPEEMYIQKYIFESMRKTVESFGYVEYGASILEPAELYKAKSGEEIVNEQTYTFTDRGDREVTLRPEMTPTVARMVANKRRELSFPLRWYSIPNLFRYERPQRGRLREHFQLNVDLFGVKDISAEVEIINLAFEVLNNLGLAQDTFEIRINSRKQLTDYLETLELDQEKTHALLKLLDKKEKIEDFEKEVEKIAGRNVSFDIAPGEKIQALQKELEELGITNIRFVPTLVRGFDYYTDIVFEIFDTNEKNRRSLFGGGRYDNLVEIFGEETIPAVGFGMGDVTIKDTLETYNLLPQYKPSIELYICSIDESSIPSAMKVARVLRGENLRVAVDLTGKKVGDQIKKADKDGIPFIICVGEKEKESNMFEVKELKSGMTESLPLEEVVSFIRQKLS